MCTGIQYLFLFLSIFSLASSQVCFDNIQKSIVDAKHAVEQHFIVFNTAINTRNKDAILKMVKNIDNSTETPEKLDNLFEFYEKVKNVKFTVKSALFISPTEIETTVILSGDSRKQSKGVMVLQKCPESPSGWQIVKIGSTTGSVQRKIPYLSCVLGPLACFIEVYVRTLNGS